MNRTKALRLTALRSATLALLALFGLAGCPADGPFSSDAESFGDTFGGSDTVSPNDGGVDALPSDGSPPPDASAPCLRTPGPADTERAVVVSHPFVGPGVKGSDFELLSLAKSGALTATGQHFSLGVVTDGEIVFTPDGEVGVVALEDGKLGVFRVVAGAVQVVHAAFSGGFYASRVVIGPEGKRAYVLDSQWRKNGGGIYLVSIGCDGSLKDRGQLAPGKLPEALALLGQDRALVAAADVLTSKAGDDAHLVDLGGSSGSPAVIAGVDAFGDDDAIVSALAVTADRRFALLADNAAFTPLGGDRIAVVGLGGGTLKAVQVLKNFKDPVGFAMSPWDNAALVLGAQADTIWVLDYAPQATQPFSLRGKLAASTSTLLPSVAVMIRRGALKGHVLISENVTLRQVQFSADGSAKEVGLHDFGTGAKAIPGALGVQP